ncbi:MAG: thiamine diphosphokinase [Clostridia bacterium]|nr:thiamine diphosphokinase [Clostridia bacterium]
MKGIILLNGDPYSGEINTDDALVYCCDGAYKWAKNKVRIDKNIGDFDSLDEVPYPAPEEIYPAEKDYTDGEIALFKLLKSGVDKIEIYGGGGGREDHFLGNLHLLYRAHSEGVQAEMLCDRSLIFPASGKIFLGNFKGTTFSVLPFGGDLHIMDSAGLKYSYPEKLCYGECRGISNIVEDSKAFLSVEGTALVIINRGEV